MKENYQEIIEKIEKQEEMLVFKSFSNQDALELGDFIVNLAKEKGLQIAVAIRNADGCILFHHLMKNTGMDNQIWMEKKANTVLMWEHSSLRLWANASVRGDVPMDDHPPKTYALCGGGFPITLKNGDTVGVLTISNLDHMDDHALAVESLAKWLKIDGVPMI